MYGIVRGFPIKNISEVRYSVGNTPNMHFQAPIKKKKSTDSRFLTKKCFQKSITMITTKENTPTFLEINWNKAIIVWRIERKRGIATLTRYNWAPNHILISFINTSIVFDKIDNQFALESLVPSDNYKWAELLTLIWCFIYFS